MGLPRSFADDIGTIRGNWLALDLRTAAPETWARRTALCASLLTPPDAPVSASCAVREVRAPPTSAVTTVLAEAGQTKAPCPPITWGTALECRLLWRPPGLGEGLAKMIEGLAESLRLT